MKTLDYDSIELSGLNLIEASAGTGKTYTIAQLYLRAIIQGHALEQVLVVTFTRAATAELRDRLRERLERALEEPDYQPHRAAIKQALAAMDLAPIYTIHGFCRRLLADRVLHHGMDISLDAEQHSSLAEHDMLALWRTQVEALAPNQYGLIAALLPKFKNFKAIYLAIKQAATVALIAAPSSDEHGWQQDLEAFKTLILSPQISRNKKNGLALSLCESLLASISRFEQTGDASMLDLQAIERLNPLSLGLSLSGKKALNSEQLALLGRAYHYYQNHIATAQADIIKTMIEACERVFQQQEAQRHRVDQPDALLVQAARLLKGGDGKELLQKIRKQFCVAFIDEFQDTDPLQWSIFSDIYAQSPKTACVLIGDPKQAIYGFRGADIATYLMAKQAVARDRRYTLATNYRSSPALLDAVAALYRADLPFAAKGIDFVEVDHCQALKNAEIRIDKQPLPGLLCPEINAKTKAEILDAFLGEIKTLLGLIAEQRVDVVDFHQVSRLLRSDDIAILCESNKSCIALQQRLAQMGIGCAIQSETSVFSSVESTIIGLWLGALKNPQDLQLLRSALLSSEAKAIDGVPKDMTALAQLHHRYNALLARHGPVAVFRAVLDSSQIDLGGEQQKRRLANFQQIAELLQAQWLLEQSAEALYSYWLDQQQNPDPSNQKLRLASQANLLQIMTIHKSKGLQYPLVFVYPIGNSKAKTDRTLVAHTKTTHGNQLEIALDPTNLQRISADNALFKTQESLRVMYVALTRAELLCVMPKVQNAKAQGPLDYLLERGGKINSLSLQAEFPSTLAAMKTLSTEAAPSKPGIRPRSLQRQWHSSAYSSLKAKSVYLPTLDIGDRDHNEPGGTEFGLLFHSLMEKIDFQSDAKSLFSVVEPSALAFGIADATPIQEMVWNSLTTPLPAFPQGLQAVTATQRLVELGFHFWSSPKALDAFSQRLEPEYPDAQPSYHGNTPKLFIKGFIDLIAEDADGRYWVIDYKTNRLPAYDQAALLESMKNSHYRLQYLLYLVALHRYLRNRIDQYDPVKHLGGALYLYVRALPEAGVFCDPVCPQFIAELSQCLEGE